MHVFAGWTRYRRSYRLEFEVRWDFLMADCKIVFSDLLVEFLEIAFNGILYSRKLYPDEAFVTKKAYSTAVHVSQHPELTEYLQNVLTTIRHWISMDSSAISAINLKFLDEDKRLLEKYVFNIEDLTPEGFRKDPYFFHSEQLVRNLLLRLTMAISYLKPLPEGSSFSIDCDVKEWAHVALCESSSALDFAWILNPESESSQESSAVETASCREDSSEKSLLPLLRVKNSALGLELFVIQMNR